VRRLGAAAAAALLLVGCAALPVPRRSPYHGSDADLGVTRIVHGSVILEMRATRVVIDPWFYSGFVIRQREPLGLTPDGLPPLAAVLLTHEHADHFDERALRELADSVPRAVAPPELAPRLLGLGFGEVTALGWWERTQVGEITVTAVPARHSVRENGYVFELNGVAVYVAGDTRYFDELVDVATRFPRLAAALLPIGGERLLGLGREMGPADAARAAAVLQASRVIPIGYGKAGGFPVRWFARRPVQRFIEECAKRGIDRSRVVVLESGESWHYYRDDTLKEDTS
jgi:L-ascorbate metabolism protein UlaG (beta-lactamase superfamily)